MRGASIPKNTRSKLVQGSIVIIRLQFQHYFLPYKNAEKKKINNKKTHKTYYLKHKEKVQERNKTRKRNKKIKAVTYKGGKCSKCGYEKCMKALEFHHLIPEEKGYDLNHAKIDKPWEILKKELDKCILLCSNCHRELECKQGC